MYRYEKSGVVHGLTRVRGLTMDDSHIYCTKEQMPGELRSLLRFVLDLLADYGLSDFYLELSTKGDTGKFIGSDEEWAEATETLRQAAVDSGLELVPDPGGAAYYGPKISVQAKDAIGRSWQMSTIQVDFNHPKRFELSYTASDGSRQQPVVLHRALFGSIERFFGVLTEHYAGAFPAWLAPVQVVGIPIADEHVPHLPASRRSCGRGASASTSTPPTTACRRRSATTRPRRCRSCCWRAARTSRPVRCRSVSATAPRSTACRSRTRCGPWSTGWSGGRTRRRRPRP